MHFQEIGRNRYRVFKSKNDTKFHGTVDKYEYISIDMATGKRVAKSFWKINIANSGWCMVAKKHFDTREEAGAFLLKEVAKPYAQRKMRWNDPPRKAKTSA